MHAETEGAEGEAQAILDAARAQAHTIEDEAARELIADLARLRRETEAAIFDERQRVEAESAATLGRIRQAAETRRPAAADAIMRLVTPVGGAGEGSKP